MRSTLFIFTLALLFAYLLSPLVNLLDRALPKQRTRTLALALAYVIFVGLVVLVGVQIGSRVVEQAQTLAEQASRYDWQRSSSPPPDRRPPQRRAKPS